MIRRMLMAAALMPLLAGKPESRPSTLLSLSYTQQDIQKDFDTLYSRRQTAAGYYQGFLEQALAACHDSARPGARIVQDVQSSMYLDTSSNVYDCVTSTTFRLPGGVITAAGVFILTPGDTIAPDHDFPITGGTGAYSGITGAYTRHYADGVYHVQLRYRKRE